MRAIRSLQAEVIVIDNCSQDGTIAYLENVFSGVCFISNEHNDGFAKANNRALRQCTGEYVLFLNPDTLIPEDVLDACLAFFADHRDAGAVGVRMVDGSGRFLPESKRAFPSPRVAFCKLSGLSSLFPRSRYFNRYAMGFLEERETHTADVLSGAFLMARRDLLLRLNGFDEAFFMYGEDIDLCYRLKEAGFNNYYLGKESIIHFKGESSRQDPVGHDRTFYDAMKIFVKKHFYRRRRFVSILLQAGIVARAVPGRIATFLHRRPARTAISDTALGCHLLVGDPVAATEAETILEAGGRGISVKKLQSLQSLSAVGEACSDLVFCTGTLGYKSCIEYVSNHPGGYRYRWHGLHTRSVVGSSEKKSTGEVLHLP